jgi:GNAT superfamily N-acetyltransferase
MTVSDVALGMRLKTQAGWNQLESDWRRFLDMQPDGCFVAELDGVPVGTTNTCIFDSVAWVAMVLVDTEVRSRGIGKALMQHALAFLDSQGVPTIRLDATPMGKPLYEKLGFVEEYTLVRYDGVLPPSPAPADSRLRSAGTEEAVPLDKIVALDQAVTATNRTKLLLRLRRENPAYFRWIEEGDAIQGYMTARDGSNAVQLGPCIADAATGPLLLADAFTRFAGRRVYIDMPTGNTPATRLAEAAGLKVVRPLTRMWRGRRINEDPARLWASYGPDLG